MPRFEHYPFRFRDPVTGKWIRARYKADLQTIALRYAEFEITGPPDIIDVVRGARYFNPLRNEAAAECAGNLGPILAIRRPGERRRFPVIGDAVPVVDRIEPTRIPARWPGPG